MSTDLATPAGHLDLEKAHAQGFTQEMRSIIRNAINPNASEADFELLLEFAGRYRLNPLNGELYLAKMPGQDGSPPRFTPIVGRAGYLSVAQRQKGYRGLRSDVVRANDTFAVAWDEEDPDGTTPKIIHRYDMTFKADPAQDEETPDMENESAEQRTVRKRGKIIGAWCKVYRENNVPTFFFAQWNEYVPRDIAKSRFWKSHPSEAVRKCAVSNAVREAFSLSGLYDEAEMARVLEDGGPATPVPDTPEYGDDDLGRRLEGLVSEAVNAGLQYRPAKVRTILHGASDEEREAFADKLETEIAESRGEKVEDAEVVEDPPAEPPQATLS